MSENRSRGLFCCTPQACGLWFAVFLVLLGGGLLLLALWPEAARYQQAWLFAAVGIACLINVRWNRVYHCAITGPFFLLVAGILALDEAGMWTVPKTPLWPIVLIVVGVALLLEWRFASRKGTS